MSSSQNDHQNKLPTEQPKTPEPKPKTPEPQIIKTVHKNLDSFDSDKK